MSRATSLLLKQLFSLPPALRLQSIQHASQCCSPVISRLAAERSFATTTVLLKTNARTPKSKSPSLRPPPPLTGKPPLAKEVPPAPPLAAPEAPSAISSAHGDGPTLRESVGQAFARKLLNLHRADEIVIYESPSHTSYFLFSYLFGFTFIIGGYNMAQWAFSPLPNSDVTKTVSRPPWYIQSMAFVPALFMTIVGTVFMMAPLKVIGRVSVFKKADTGKPMLRFWIKPTLPVYKPVALDREINQVFIDRHITGIDVDYFSVPISNARVLTEAVMHPKPISRTFAQRISAPFKALNKSLIHAWPTTRQNARKMFTREGIVYMHLDGRGTCKLDLWHAHIVDHGRPLESLTIADPNLRLGFARWVQKQAWRRTVT